MRALVRSAALAIAFTLLITAAFAYYLPIQDPYHPLNTGWNGCSAILYAYGNTTILSSDQAYLAPRGSVLAIMGPNLDFTRRDGLSIHAFLEEGGTVILADNFGTGNLLLERLNVSARISGKPLSDLYFYSRNPQFPIVFDFSSSPITADLTEVVLNHPSYLLTTDPTFTILASSSPFSFVDLDEGRLSANETTASYPVIATTHVGKGTLVVISDPNVFTNEMIGLFDNMLLFRNLMRGSNHLIIDAAHLRTALLTPYRIYLKQEINSTQQFLFFSQASLYLQWASLAVVIVALLITIFRRSPMTEWVRCQHGTMLNT